MAIDSASDRLSAECVRRLPWFRRFFPRPSGEVDVADRQQVGFMYNGFIPEDPALPVVEITVRILR